MVGLFESDSEYDKKSISELIDLVFNERKSPSHRFSALVSLGFRAREDPNLVPVLEQMATSQELQEVRFLHPISLAYLAVAGLANCGTSEAKAAARKAINTFSDIDQEGIAWLLKSGDFSL